MTGADCLRICREHLFSKLAPSASETPDDIWFEGLRQRMLTIEDALSRLDARGVSGPPERRLAMVVAAEVMPPDDGNAERAKRLDAMTPILRDYLEEAI